MRIRQPKRPLTRPGSALALAVLAIAATGTPVHAQLPLAEFAEAPDLRLASADAFVDRLRTAGQRISDKTKEREPAIVETQRQLERKLAAAGRGDLLQPFDTATARRLLAELQDELELRRNAAEAITRAASRASQIAEAPPDGIQLDDIVVVAEGIRRNQGIMRQKLGLANRLRLLGTAAPDDDPGTDLGRQVRRQRLRVTEAEADRAEALALEAEAEARFGRQQLATVRTAWHPTPEQIDAADAHLSTAEQQSAEQQKRLRARRARTATVTRARASESAAERQARQAQLDADVADIGYQSLRADARVLRAQARRATLQHRLGTRTVEPNLTASALVLRLAGLDQAARRIDRRLGQLDGVEGSRRLRRAAARERNALQSSLRALREARSDFSRALIYAEIRDDPRETRSRTTRSRELGFVLSLFVLLASVFLLARGYRWGQVILRAAHDVLPSGRRLSERTQARIGTVAVLLWPIAVAAATAALLIWPVWGMSLTIREAVQLIDRPLFFVDQTGVSILSLVKLAFAIYAANILSTALRDFLQARVYPQTDWDIGLTTALDTLVHYTTMTIGLVVAMRFVGVGFSALAILAGVLGIGIGFGLRNVTENFISGLIILAERPIKIGDFIAIGPADLEGRVQRIRARSTTVITRDNISVIIPNSEFVAGRVTNWSHGDARVRIAVKVGVAYGSDTALVQDALLEVAHQHPSVLRDPKPEVEFEAFGASSLDFVLRTWIVQQADRFRIASDLRFAIDAAFRTTNIVIAFPQLDVHIRSPATGVDAPGPTDKG